MPAKPMSTQQTRAAGDFVDYTYDDLGQLKTARGKESGGSTTRWHEQLGYAYDAAGNLNYRTNNMLVQTFTVNDLNQINTVVRSGTMTVAGTTTSPATNVTVNTYEADRYADETFTRTNLTLVDGNNTFTAIAKDNLGRIDTNAVTLNLPASVTLAWDKNGSPREMPNPVRIVWTTDCHSRTRRFGQIDGLSHGEILRTNGTRFFDYDDENQLIRVTVAGEWQSEFTYDGKMRRRVRKEFTWQNSAWVQTNETRYVYDGNLVIYPMR